MLKTLGITASGLLTSTFKAESGFGFANWQVVLLLSVIVVRWFCRKDYGLHHLLMSEKVDEATAAINTLLKQLSISMGDNKSSSELWLCFGRGADFLDVLQALTQLPTP